MHEEVNIISQLIDQALKAGLIGNIQTAVAVNNAWEKIKAAVNERANSNNGN